MALFHPFPLLAPELRNRIWELTIEPREVVIDIEVRNATQPTEKRGYDGYTPAVLHACTESRSLLTAAPFYIKAFQPFYTKRGEKPLRYIWVNFTVDTINAGTQRYEKLEEFIVERPLTRRLIIQPEDCQNAEDFSRFRMDPIKRNLSRLESLEIRVNAERRRHGHELPYWIEIMGEFVEPEEWPVTFDVRIVFSKTVEINAMNYTALKREDLRLQGFESDMESEANEA